MNIKQTVSEALEDASPLSRAFEKAEKEPEFPGRNKYGHKTNDAYSEYKEGHFTFHVSHLNNDVAVHYKGDHIATVSKYGGYGQFPAQYKVYHFDTRKESFHDTPSHAFDRIKHLSDIR